MAGEKSTEKTGTVGEVLELDPVVKLAEQDAASGKEGIASDSMATISSSTGFATGIKGESLQQLAGEHGVNPHTSYYNYHYPGYGGSFTHVDDNGYFQADGLHTGMQSENGSVVYYLPGYNPYATGSLMGVNSQSVGQQPYFSSGYLQPHVSYGSEAYPYDSTYVGDVFNGNIDASGNVKYGPGSTTFTKSSGYNSVTTNGNAGSKLSNSTYGQPLKSPTKVPHLSSDPSVGSFKGHRPDGKFSSFNNQKQGIFPRPVNYRPNGRVWNQNDRYKTFNRNFDFENSAELTRGPRAQNRNANLDSSTKKEELGPAVRRDKYNLPDLQIEYKYAKFFVIKSYSEDDIHKSVKYDVWSSTPNGNKKLNAAYSDVEVKESETGTNCPVFLFYSVNGSGQFVGLAEMVGLVDFDKDMDFWQVDKWNGFFPVKWHIVKDIPNHELSHIILENNENKPVTHSRDTQEIGLKQGLEMLKIFKDYSPKASLLDDFSFYEKRQKSLRAKKSEQATLRMEIFKDDGFTETMGGENNVEEDLMRTKRTTMGADSLINLTKNLSLNGCNRTSSAVKNRTH